MPTSQYKGKKQGNCGWLVPILHAMVFSSLYRSYTIDSVILGRTVQCDVYGQEYSASTQQPFYADGYDLLLINDGQDLIKMKFDQLLESFADQQAIAQRHVSQQESTHGRSSRPIVVVGIHAGPERKQEYGVSGHPDYMGRGTLASAYAGFVLKELLPFLLHSFKGQDPVKKYLAGFSLGGLMAFDMLMDHPDQFSAVGVFSGAFWWRSMPLGPGYDDALHRIMHTKVQHKKSVPGLRFFLQTGQLDETEDRNKNGIIDSIDDTLDIITALEKLGYRRGLDIDYLELPDGQHNTATWARVMPLFLNWLLSLR